jgi:hypothetical protein
MPENQNEFVHVVFALVVTECLKYRLITNEYPNFGHGKEIKFKDNEMRVEWRKRQKRRKRLLTLRSVRLDSERGINPENDYFLPFKTATVLIPLKMISLMYSART